MDRRSRAVTGTKRHPGSPSSAARLRSRRSGSVRRRCRCGPFPPPLHRAAVAVLLLLLALASTGCGPDPLARGGDDILALPELLPYEVPEYAGPSFEVRDSAGVEVISNGAVGAWGPSRAEVEVALDLRNVMTSGTDHEFSSISHVLSTPEGGVLVAERAKGIRTYDSGGDFVRWIARDGEGPGEVQRVDEIWFVGDSVFVSDPGQGRVTAFSLDGTVLREWSTEGRATPVVSSPQGWVAVVDVPALFQCRGVGIDGAIIHTARPVRYATWDPEEARPGESILELRPRLGPAPEESASSPMCPLFRQPVPDRAFDRAGHLFVANLDRYRIEVRDALGQFRRVVTREHTPRPLGRPALEEMEVEIRRYAYLDEMGDIEDLWYPDWFARLGSRWSASQVIGQLERAAERGMPDHVQPLGELLVSPDGGFWVERMDALPAGQMEFHHWILRGLERPPPSRWDLFDPDGRFLGTVELPLAFEPTAVEGLEVVGVVEDELGVQSVVRYRAVPPDD